MDAVIFLESLLSGVGGAIVAAVLWFAVAFMAPLYGPYLTARLRGTGGVSSANVGSNSILLAALIGFIVAFTWSWHRLRVP